MNNETYLGDGLYVEFDGFQFVLKANDPMNPSDKVYLEPRVLDALNIFAKKVYGKTIVVGGVEYVSEDSYKGCEGCALRNACPENKSEAPYCENESIIFLLKK